MDDNRIKQIHNLGQSIWLDFIDRKIVANGVLQKMIDEDGVSGVTSNPAIFEKAVSAGTDYDLDIKALAEEGLSAEEIFFKFAAADIQYAADMFKTVYENGQVKGADGFVSLEVSPLLAHNAPATVAQAKQLWKEVDRDNLMVKIPGTAECISAIQTCIAEGINVNVTLLFGLQAYQKVAEAYIAGLEERSAAGKSLEGIASVASFFLSRIDTLIDPMLDEKNLPHLKGMVAIASAKKAYALYKEIFSSPRFQKLEQKGAQPQRLLWASTGTKNPAYRDTMYVEELIGPKTVNTIPMDTLEAFRNHGEAAVTLERDLEGATEVLNEVKSAGIDIEAVAAKLEDEGIEKFIQPYNKLIAAIESQKAVPV